MKEKILKVYVAGAFSDDNVLGVLKNIGRGEWYASQLFVQGFAPFTPWHDKTFVFNNWEQALTVEMFYNYSIAWLEVSDVMFVIPNWKGLKNHEDSKGTQEEIRIANELGIPVFYNNEELTEYAREKGFKVR